MNWQKVSPTAILALCGDSTVPTVACVRGKGVFIIKPHRDGVGLVATRVTDERYLKVAREQFQQLTKAKKTDILLFCQKEPKDFAVRAALVKCGAIQSAPGPDTKDERTGGKGGPKKKGYAPGEVIGFGKYGPGGEGLTIQQLIDKHPGYCNWLVENFGDEFFNAEAKALYKSKQAQYERSGRDRRREQPGTRPLQRR